MRIPIYGGKKINHQILKTEGTFIRMSFETISQHYHLLVEWSLPCFEHFLLCGQRGLFAAALIYTVILGWTLPLYKSYSCAPVLLFGATQNSMLFPIFRIFENTRHVPSCIFSVPGIDLWSMIFSQHWSMTVSDLSLLMEHTLNYNVSHYSAKLELKPHVVGQAHNPLAGML